MIQLAPVAVVMAANLGERPAAVIDVNDDTAADYWAYRLNVTRDQLFTAIGEVGSSVVAVRRHLGK
jgi:hypothetical protein